jgi:hypothetical protein
MDIQSAIKTGKFFKRGSGLELIVTAKGEIWDCSEDAVAALTAADLLATDWTTNDASEAAYEAFDAHPPQS